MALLGDSAYTLEDIIPAAPSKTFNDLHSPPIYHLQSRCRCSDWLMVSPSVSQFLRLYVLSLDFWLTCDLTFLAARIYLDESHCYLITCEVLDQLGFVSHKALQVLICRKCHYSFIPDEVVGHAHGCRNVSPRSIDLEEFQKLILRQPIHLEVLYILHLLPQGPPVEGITEVKRLACSMDPVLCAYCCCSLKGMETHIRTHPNHPPNMKNCYWVNVQLQTLFKKFGVKYFEVEPTFSNVSNGDPLACILRDFLPKPGNESTSFWKVMTLSHDSWWTPETVSGVHLESIWTSLKVAATVHYQRILLDSRYTSDRLLMESIRHTIQSEYTLDM
jgi:hypothetical protein